MQNVGIQDDAMAQAILGAIRKGPLSDSQLLGLFQRNRKGEEIHGVLARLRQAKQIDFTTEATTGRPKRIWHVYEKSNEKTQAPGKRRIFCSLRFPSLTIGKAIKFQAGFYQTDSTEEQRLIEQSGEYNLSVRDITEVLRAIPLSKRKKVYLSSQLSVQIEHHPRLKAIDFKAVADGLYVLANEDPDLDRFIEHSELFRTGEIREVPRGLLEESA